VGLDPYGWHSPEQTADRFAQRLELAARRRTNIALPSGLFRAVRTVACAALRGFTALQDADRRAAAALEGFIRR
jgi:hypothetical protein